MKDRPWFAPDADGRFWLAGLQCRVARGERLRLADRCLTVEMPADARTSYDAIVTTDLAAMRLPPPFPIPDWIGGRRGVADCAAERRRAEAWARANMET